MTIIENNQFEINDTYFDKEDVLNLYRLQKQLLVEESIVATLDECLNIWSNYSNDLSASWLYFPANDIDILRSIKSSDFFTNFNDYAL